MKKICTATALFLSFVCHAQDVFAERPPSDILTHKIIDLLAIVFLVYLATAFILAITRLVMDNRLKTNMTERGLSPENIQQLLQINRTDSSEEAIKWCFVFGSMSAGFFIARFFTPFGLHTLAILAGCMGIGFFLYYLFLQRSSKP